MGEARRTRSIFKTSFESLRHSQPFPLPSHRRRKANGEATDVIALDWGPEPEIPRSQAIGGCVALESALSLSPL